MKPKSSISRLVGLFVLLSVVPLALLTWFTVHKASDTVTGEVEARMRSTAAVSAVAVQKEMQGLADLVESYAKRPTLVTALGDPAHYDPPDRFPSGPASAGPPGHRYGVPS